MGKDAAAHGVFIKEFLGQMEFVKGRLIDLEQAMPQAKATWRPSEGVRSVSEVYLHTAFGNYLFLKFSGLGVPDDIKEQMDAPKWEKQTMDKAKIKQIMERSFADISKASKKLTVADLEKTIHVFGTDMSVRNFMMTMLSHLHEHLGQAIAYARINGVVPPWSVKSAEEIN